MPDDSDLNTAVDFSNEDGGESQGKYSLQISEQEIEESAAECGTPNFRKRSNRRRSATDMGLTEKTRRFSRL